MLAMLLVIAWQNVSANQETLSFRLNNLRQIEAVISGMAGCGLFVVSSVDTIEISLSVISINSIQGGMGGGCPTILPPPVPYEVVAVLGDLPRQTYTVNWTTSLSRAGPRSPLVSAILAVDALFLSVPTVSGAGVALLALLLLVVGWFVLRRRN
jgi:hypothetical protein